MCVREISLDKGSKGINPCNLALMCNADLDEIAASEKPEDPAFVVKYQKLALSLCEYYARNRLRHELLDTIHD